SVGRDFLGAVEFRQCPNLMERVRRFRLQIAAIREREVFRFARRDFGWWFRLRNRNRLRRAEKRDRADRQKREKPRHDTRARDATIASRVSWTQRPEN